MHAYRHVIDRCSIERQNGNQRAYIDHIVARYNQLTLDLDRKERMAAQQCVVCWKAGRIGGAAFTTRQCGLCDTTLHSGSTNIDVLCPECARRAKLCRHCGADLELKNRRARDLPERTPDLQEVEGFAYRPRPETE